MNSIFDLFQLIASNVWIYGGTFLLVLSILVFVHEWGHYIVARMCGVKVETFSIGFGKEIFGLYDKHGTRWKFSMIPLGGYVKMFGDSDPASAGKTEDVKEGDAPARPMTEEEKKVAFFAKPVWQRALVVFAGPGINFIFAIILLTGLYATQGQPVTPPLASAVVVGSAADAGGFEPHDRVISINGEKVNRFEDIRRIVAIALDTPLEFVVERDGKEVTFTATPEKEEMTDRFGFKQSRGLLGIIGPSNGFLIDTVTTVDGQAVNGADEARAALLRNMDKDIIVEIDRGEELSKLRVTPLSEVNTGLQNPESEDFSHLILTSSIGDEFIHHSVPSAFVYSIKETWSITVSTLKALGQMITGTRSAQELGGIIRIGAIAGDMAQAGFIALITFTALLSINLGLINLFPIPMLDGGHLVFYAVEALKGSPIKEEVQEYAFRFGFVILIGIMLFTNLNDVIQLIR